MPAIRSSSFQRSTADSVVHCIEAGAEDYLTKPFNPILPLADRSGSLEKSVFDREKEICYRSGTEKGALPETLLLNILPLSIVNRMLLEKWSSPIASLKRPFLFCDLVGSRR